MRNLTLNGISVERLSDRRRLLSSFDTLRRDLDASGAKRILAALQSELNQREKTTVVMVTHDLLKAEQTARTIRLFDGRQVN